MIHAVLMTEQIAFLVPMGNKMKNVLTDSDQGLKYPKHLGNVGF